MPRLSHNDIKKELIIENPELIGDKLNPGKGLLLCGAHFGNWEMMPHFFGRIISRRLNIIVKEQRNTSADKRINKIRASNGNHLISMKNSMRELLRLLHDGEIIAMLSDQYSPNGIKINFFNLKVIFPEGIARIAVRKQSPVIYGSSFRNRGGKYLLKFTGILPKGDSEDEKIKSIIQQYATLLEEDIRKSPGHWLWFHRRFKSLISY